MATKRTPINRPTKQRITEEAVAAFLRGDETREIYIACSRGGPCQSPKQGERCATCESYFDSSRALHRALGVKIWETSPLDAVSEVPPDWMRNNPLQVGEWDRAWKLRQELLEAAKQ